MSARRQRPSVHTPGALIALSPSAAQSGGRGAAVAAAAPFAFDRGFGCGGGDEYDRDDAGAMSSACFVFCGAVNLTACGVFSGAEDDDRPEDSPAAPHAAALEELDAPGQLLALSPFAARSGGRRAAAAAAAAPFALDRGDGACGGGVRGAAGARRSADATEAEVEAAVACTQSELAAKMAELRILGIIVDIGVGDGDDNADATDDADGDSDATATEADDAANDADATDEHDATDDDADDDADGTADDDADDADDDDDDDDDADDDDEACAEDDEEACADEDEEACADDDKEACADGDEEACADDDDVACAKEELSPRSVDLLVPLAEASRASVSAPAALARNDGECCRVDDHHAGGDEHCAEDRARSGGSCGVAGAVARPPAASAACHTATLSM